MNIWAVMPVMLADISQMGGPSALPKTQDSGAGGVREGHPSDLAVEASLFGGFLGLTIRL